MLFSPRLARKHKTPLFILGGKIRSSLRDYQNSRKDHDKCTHYLAHGREDANGSVSELVSTQAYNRISRVTQERSPWQSAGGNRN